MPPKNRMAQRRRRHKRLDDGLAMLRSVVPMNSKLEEENASSPGFVPTDGVSILGDTVDYMKELQERIRRLQEEQQPAMAAPLRLIVPREMEPSQMVTPRFEVERRQEVGDTRVEIRCAAKSGLLLSTAESLDALGLDVNHCVVSCFGDFAMHASCSESEVRGDMLGVDAMKQQLQKNAGYGGGEEEGPQQEQ